MVVDGTALPAWLDLPSFSPADLAACQIFQVVEHEPSLTLRTPEPLLWLAARPYVDPLPGAALQPLPIPTTSWHRPIWHHTGRFRLACHRPGLRPPQPGPLLRPLSRATCSFTSTRARSSRSTKTRSTTSWPPAVASRTTPGAGSRARGQKFRTALQDLLCSQSPTAPTTLSAPTAPAAREATAVGAAPAPQRTLVRGRPPRKQAGAPCQPYNLRLERTIEKLPDIHAYHHLEQPWLKWHKAATGEDLAAPKRSFATTAQRCVARIERRRANACGCVSQL